MYKIPCDLAIQTDYLTLPKRLDQVLTTTTTTTKPNQKTNNTKDRNKRKKKKTTKNEARHPENFTVPTDHRMKTKDKQILGFFSEN